MNYWQNAGFKAILNLEDIHTILLESNGKLSILPVSITRPLTPNDINISPEQDMPMANIIIDGKIMSGNLKYTGKNEAWLKKRLTQKGVSDIKEIILATFDNTKDDINVYLKNHKKYKNDIFE